jgi:hypothetical protein
MNVGDKVCDLDGFEYEIVGRTEGGLIIVDEIDDGVPLFEHRLFTEEQLTLKEKTS